MKRQIEQAMGDAAGLERLYRQVRDTGDEGAFKEAIAQCAEANPNDMLLSAWAYRLDIQSPPDGAASTVQAVKQSQIRHWRTAIGTALALGILYAIFAGGKPPVPAPEAADPLFWIGWGPLTALGIIFFLAAVDRAEQRIRRYGGWAVAIIPVAVYSALIGWGRTDSIAGLIAIHLPFASWAAVGAALSLGRPDPLRQCYAFLVKSVETMVNGGIYFGAGVVFLGLTVGIFSVLGIRLPDDAIQTAAAWGIGVIPILALASVYDPMAAPTPAAQSRASGLARLLRIMTRLILPLALGVLVVYVFWFIPAYFRRPFEEREVLIVYNATIMAILVLLTAAVSDQDEQRDARQDAILRYAVLSLGILTLLLNVYALTAIASRTLESGLTPNRYAVFGWNIVTMLMLSVIVIRLLKARPEGWVPVFRDALARVSVLAVAWSLWVLIGLPLSFD